MNNKKKIFSIILALLFLILALLMSQGHLKSFDDTIYRFVIQFQSANLTLFFRQISHFGDGMYVIFFCALTWVFSRSIAKFAITNVILTVTFNNALKMIFARTRPSILRLVEIGGYSFPSGHAMMSMAFYGLFIYLIYQSKFKRYTKIIMITLLAILISLIGLSRIYLGVHYASDILAGYLCSIFYLIVFISIYNLAKERKERKIRYRL